MHTIDAKGVYYKELNQMVRQALAAGAAEITLKNVNGQRYLGDGISGQARLVIEGTPGNDLAAYMDGLELIIRGNAQDGVGNTMNSGTVVIYGDAGDVTGYGMRGGEIFIRGDVGYRVGIHMKAYLDKVPVIVVGGKAGDFFAEYMAGGTLVLLGLDLALGEEMVGNFCGTGMHGGAIYIRGEIAPHKLGKEVKVVDLEAADEEFVRRCARRYGGYFGVSEESIMAEKFYKLIPFNKRPYGNLYANY